MSHQEALTVVAAIRPDRLAQTRATVEELAKDPGDDPRLPLARLPFAHFARLMIVEDSTADGVAHLLVLMVDCDGSALRTVRDLVEASGAGLDEVFGGCTDYPEAPSAQQRADFLREHRQRSAVFYVHSVGRTLAQIRGEARLRAAVEEFLDREHDRLGRLTPSEIRREVQRFVAGDDGLAWALRAPARPGIVFRLRELVHKLAVPAALVLALPVVVAFLLVWIVRMRWHERHDAIRTPELDPVVMRALGDAEDVVVQNAFTSLAPIKSGRFWRLTSWMSLQLGTYTARHVFTRGSLSGLTTVHFARFMHLGRERKLLFTSYYDGSLESYNNDFVDQVAWVLNTVFGQQDGYPRTRWLVHDGAHDEQGFKAFIRGHQIANQVWWSAYPQLAAVTIDQNARLRAGLRGAMSQEEARAWLALS